MGGCARPRGALRQSWAWCRWGARRAFGARRDGGLGRGGAVSSLLERDGEVRGCLTERDGSRRIARVRRTWWLALVGALAVWPAVLVPQIASAAGLSAYVTNGISGNVSQLTVGAGGTLEPQATPTVAGGDGPAAIAVSPNGEYVYIANSLADGSGGVSQYVVGSGGTLAPMATPTVAGGDGPRGVAVSPNGEYVYVANAETDGSSGVSQYTVGPGGVLSPMATPTVAGGDQPDGIAVSPNGEYLYVANYDTDGPGGVSQYTVGSGGALSPMATPTVAAGNKPQWVAENPSGQTVYALNSAGGVSQYTVVAGGALEPTATPTVALGDGPNAMALTPDQGPVASFTASAAPAGSASSFNGSDSNSFESTVADYEWSFGDGSTLVSGSPSVTHAYARPGRYTAQLTVADLDGCSTFTMFTGQTAYCNGNARATTTRTVVVPPVRLEPGISKLRVSPGKFSAAGRKVHGRCVRASQKPKLHNGCQLAVHLTATYTLNVAVEVSLNLSLETTGRDVGGRCVKATRKNRRKHKCALPVSVHTTITRSGAVGSNRSSFTVKLAAGIYRLVATPAGGTSLTATFRVTG